jgi:hypothetical protein
MYFKSREELLATSRIRANVAPVLPKYFQPAAQGGLRSATG